MNVKGGDEIFLILGARKFWVAKIGKMSIESRLEGANPHGG